MYRRRAVVIGINYTCCGEIALKGCCNDAHTFALTLINLFQFDPKDILLLTDHPSVYEASELRGIPHQLPYRSNIIQSLRWLLREANNGDVLVFYFSGHGLQLDNLSGWEGEGYDEAILPLDCTHEFNTVNAITSVTLRKYLLSSNKRVQLSIFMDTASIQSSLDVACREVVGRPDVASRPPVARSQLKSAGEAKAGISDFLRSTQFITGVVQKGIWPLTDPTDKMSRAIYNQSVWEDPRMRVKDVRPRFVPGVEVNDTQILNDTLSPSHSGHGEKTHAFMFCAAKFSQVPIEGLLPSLRLKAVYMQPNRTIKFTKEYITVDLPWVHHGLFTWSLIKAFYDSVKTNGYKFTYSTLINSVQRHVVEATKAHGLIKVNQCPTLTWYTASESAPGRHYVFFPFGGSVPSVKFHHASTPEVLHRFKNNAVLNVSRGDMLTMSEISNSAVSYYKF